MPTLIKLLRTFFLRPPVAPAPPALTPRTSPPICPVCNGSGRAQGTIILGILPPIPVWEYCRACGSAGVVPAVILARDPGTSEELRRYVADYMRN